MFSAIMFLIGLVVTFALFRAPKTQVKDPTRADIEAPVAELGKNIPVLFGTVLIQDANVAWWGDFRTKAIKTKGKK